VNSKRDGCEYLKQVHPSMVLWSLSNEIHSVESSSYFRLIEQVSYQLVERLTSPLSKGPYRVGLSLQPLPSNVFLFYLFIAFFTIYSRYLKRVISKRDGCEYLKQVPSIDGSLELT
jgi:hypothetical protein